MRKFTLLILILTFWFFQGCAGVGVSSVTLPDVQAFEYKDIVSCVKLDAFPGHSDCRIKVGEGAFITLRIKTSEIPTNPDAPVEPAPQ